MKPPRNIFLALLLASSSFAKEPIVETRFLDPQDGETVVFLGDSITHQCLYTQYIEDFFYTRYPDRRINFHNAGVSGDKAADALARFETDVAALEPDFVTLLLGMNDGQYEAFSEETLTTYQTGMVTLLDRIKNFGAEAVALSPTMYDHHQLDLRMKDESFRFRDRTFDSGYNALMAHYGAWLREESGERGLPFVDLWGPLNDHTFQQRRSQPDFTLVEDTIHPGAAGHFVMAVELLLDSQQERPNVSGISLHKRGGKWTASKSETISDLAPDVSGKGVTFIHTARSLPWVVPEGSSAYDLKWGESAPPSIGAELTKAGHRLGQERFRVSGLEPGRYELLIDGEVIAEFTHTQLGGKVELQKFSSTPQSRQAMRVAELNRERNDEAVRPMRDLWSRVKGLRRAADPDRFEKESPVLMAKIVDLQEKAADYENSIYEEAQPIPRKYELRPIAK